MVFSYRSFFVKREVPIRPHKQLRAKEVTNACPTLAEQVNTADDTANDRAAPPVTGLCHPARQRKSPLEIGIQTLFAFDGLLLIADFHSSWIAHSAKWESNPVIDALAGSLGQHPALAAVKSADLAALLVMYVLWKRTQAHAVMAGVLCIVSMQYAPVVLDNYFG